MRLTLTPSELRGLLTPPRLTLKGPTAADLYPQRDPLDLDAMSAPASLSRTTEVKLEDLRHAKEELERTGLMLVETQAELALLVSRVGKVRPVLEADRVIVNAGAHALDLARMFFLEAGSETWYDGIRSTIAALVSTLGVEVDDEMLEAHLAPREREPDPPLAAPAGEFVPPRDAPEAEPLIVLTDADAPKQRDTYHAIFGSTEKGGTPRAADCKHCGTELRLYPEGWIDCETHLTAEDGHTHEPAEDADGAETKVENEEVFF